jgi:hypothetical protein
VAALPANPVSAAVAFVRIAGFGARPVAEQAALKEALEAKAREAIAAIGAAERAVLDAEDGIAMVFFGDPSRALDAGQALQAGSQAPLHVGINYGPLALTSRGADGRVFGDGLSAASAAARFATPGRLLVTREYARALEAQAPDRAATLASAGDFTDTRVRQHSLYAHDPRRVASRRLRLVGYAAAGALALVLLGFAAREARRVLVPPAPSVIELSIRPRGEVLVDGVSQGWSPPLTFIEAPAGRHLVTVRAPSQPPLELTVNLKAGERMTIAHTFAQLPPKAPPKGDFWRDLKKKLGGS